MFKFPPFAGGVTPFRNGGSVPSIRGTVSLDAALADVARCERALEAARSVAKSTARREGKSVRNLFSDGAFVARSSAEKWCDEARREGEKAMINILSRSVDAEAQDDKSPFQHIAKRLKQPGAMERQRAVAAKLDAAGFQDALDVRDYDEAARILVQVRREEETGHVTGAAILKAAKDRRMGGPEVPPPPEGSFAQRVAAAAKKARSPTGVNE